MPLPNLAAISRLNLVLAVVATALGGVLWQGPGMLAAGIGATLGYFNFRVIARIGKQAMESVAGGATPDEAQSALGRLMLRMALKMVALLGLVWVVLTVFKLAVAPFALGVSIFVVSILLAAAGWAPQPKPSQQSEAL